MLGPLLLAVAATRAESLAELSRKLDGLIEEQAAQEELLRKIVAARSFAQASAEPEEGVHFLADYNVSDIKETPEYRPVPQMPFKYPEHLPGLPPFFVLSHKPKVFYFPRLLADSECDEIVRAAKSQMQRSQVTPLRGSGDSESVSDVRTSSGAWLDDDVPAVRSVRDTISALAGFQREPGQAPGQPFNGQFEKLQILRYGFGQQYRQHSDFFEPRMYGPQRSNRAATMFMYLTSVEQGGHTSLPRANGGSMPRGYDDCSVGLRVVPRKGAAVLFYDMRPDLMLDEYSLHGGCPVLKGVKWAAAQWLRVRGRWDDEHQRQGMPDPDGPFHM